MPGELLLISPRYCSNLSHNQHDVYRDEGEYLGILKEIIPIGSNDVYVVKGNKSEYLIPATHEVIRKIDTRNNKMIISVLEGLLELNEG